MAKRHTLNVFLPPDWYEVPDQSPKAYRLQGSNSGWLRLRLLPKEPDFPEQPEAIVDALQQLLASLELDMGVCQGTTHGPCMEGTFATSLWRSKSQGLMQFWVIPCRVLVFASYTDMGNLQTVQRELADAQSIIDKTVLMQQGEVRRSKDIHSFAPTIDASR